MDRADLLKALADKLEGRKLLFLARVGSTNYNLNREDSDKDFKVFFAPAFDDLYDGIYLNVPDCKIDGDDYNFHDVRKLNKLWWQANINFLEVLFSDEVILSDSDEEVFGLLQDIFVMRNDIARMNLPYLYDACIGMSNNKLSLMHKGTEGTQYLVDRYKYDTKQFLHSYRVLDFLGRFACGWFNDFKEAITYDDELRKSMLELKDGKYTEDEARKLVLNYQQVIHSFYRDTYKSKVPDESTNGKLKSILREIVRVCI
jgi:predicted nucleotidyltransferase